jgi:hypothetical protein
MGLRLGVDELIVRNDDPTRTSGLSTALWISLNRSSGVAEVVQGRILKEGWVGETGEGLSRSRSGRKAESANGVDVAPVKKTSKKTFQRLKKEPENAAELSKFIRDTKIKPVVHILHFLGYNTCLDIYFCICQSEMRQWTEKGESTT